MNKLNYGLWLLGLLVGGDGGKNGIHVLGSQKLNTGGDSCGGGGGDKKGLFGIQVLGSHGLNAGGDGGESDASGGGNGNEGKGGS